MSVTQVATIIKRQLRTGHSAVFLISALPLLLAACQEPAPPTANTVAAAAPTQAATPDKTASQSNVSVLARLSLKNPSDFARPDSVIKVTFNSLGIRDAAMPLSVWHVNPAGHSPTTDQEIPSQRIDTDGDGRVDTLLLVADFAAGEQQQWHVQATASATQFPARVHAEISQKTGGAWDGKVYRGGQFESVQSLTPPPQYTDHSEFIRYEGPGIESDKVAYRIYLDWRNGFDIFGNVTQKPVLSQVGLDGYSSYHEMQPWGLDLLKVGPSLGTGGFGYWDEQSQSVQGLAQVAQHTATILQDGPLSAAFAIDYKDWQIAGRTLDVRATLTMQAGSRLVHNKLQFSAPHNQTKALDNVVIGLVKHPDTALIQGELEISGHQYSYLATYGKQSLNNDLLGMAVLFKKGQLKTLTADAHSHVAVLELTGVAPQTPGQDNPARVADYYFLAAWQGEPGGVQNQAEFAQYLKQQAEILDRPIRLTISNPATEQLVQTPLSAELALNVSQMLADSGLAHQTPHYVWGGWDFERHRPTTLEYTTGLLLQAYDDLANAPGIPNAAYAEAVANTASSFVGLDAKQQVIIHGYQADKFNIDSINSGKLLLRQFSRSGEARYQQAAALLYQQLQQQPKTSDGGLWHKKIYPEQVWLDGVYMAMPFLAEYCQRFLSDHAEQAQQTAKTPQASKTPQANASLATKAQCWQQVGHEFALVQQKMRDSESGWYFHGYDAAKQQTWANPTTGLSPEVWARGVGWLAMALVDTVEVLAKEENHPAPQQQDPQQPAQSQDAAHTKQLLQQMTTQLALTLKNSRDAKSGVWLQLPLKPDFVGNYPEASASAMFVYFLAKAQNLGLIGDDYRQLTLDSYQALLNNFLLIDAQNQAHFTNIVQVAGLGFGRDGSAAYYSNEPQIWDDAKGVGPMMMAGIQVAQLLAKTDTKGAATSPK